MRITNNMITSNTKYNINANKVLVDKYNRQMTTHKKINKASEDPVIAIRSLRMGTNLSHLTQYLDNNIADANAWIEVTETALNNMKNILTDIRTQCVGGSSDQLEAKDRDTLLKNLKSLQEQVYTEGNADYAGRTVFTGYRTNCPLTFREDEQDTTYEIKQNFTYEDLKEQRYYYGETEVPIDTQNPCTTEIGTDTYERLRLAYNKVDKFDSITVTNGDGTAGPTLTVTSYATKEDWLKANGAAATPQVDLTTEMGPNDVVFIEDTGEMIFGKDIGKKLAQDKCTFEVNYTKTGFAKNEPRPEYYFDCTMQTPDMPTKVTYTKEEQKIEYVISSGITLPVNTQADEVFGTDIGRDVGELIDVVSAAINANDKVDKINRLMERDQFSSEADQKVLQGYLDAAKKEAAYANDHLQKTFSQYITNFDEYLEDVNIGLTNLGSLENRLDLTQTRVENQKMTVELLKSSNEDRDISDIIIDYYASYNAYTASLTAASKVGQQTLLNYL